MGDWASLVRARARAAALTRGPVRRPRVDQHPLPLLPIQHHHHHDTTQQKALACLHSFGRAVAARLAPPGAAAAGHVDALVSDTIAAFVSGQHQQHPQAPSPPPSEAQQRQHNTRQQRQQQLQNRKRPQQAVCAADDIDADAGADASPSSSPAAADQSARGGGAAALRLVLRHDCQSSGCGDAGCGLCQFNPSRVCTRNLKQKYLIDDALRAKCGAPLRVELVDAAGRRRRLENGGSGGGGGGGGGSVLPRGARLEACVLNGERYRELCPDGVGGGAVGPLSAAALASCILAPQNPKKPLLKREPAAGGGVVGGGASNSAGGGFTADGRAILQLGPDGAAPLSDLAVAASSEALLAGKAPTFRLLVWAVVDAHSDSDSDNGTGGGGGGNGGCSSAPLPGVAYVVSEAFVVATKRVKHAVKSDIPCVADHVSKLVHIGKATVAKLTCGDLRRVSNGTPAPGTGDTTTLFPFCPASRPFSSRNAQRRSFILSLL